MTRYVLALAAAAVSFASEATALERNFTIRGSGYVDAGGRLGRLALHEARLTLEDNGDFAVTLFTSREQLVVRGNWDRRRTGNVQRLSIENAWGQRAEGTGTLQYRRDGDASPERLVLDGRMRNGTSFHAVIDETRRNPTGDPGGWDRGGWDRDGGVRPGNRVRLRSSIDATTYGDGLVRMASVRGGDFSTVRARLETDGDVRIDIDRSTKGTIRGEVRDVRGDRIAVQVIDMFGYAGSGELILTMRAGGNEVARINGSGTSRGGSWQLDFTGTTRRDDRWDDDRWGNGRDRTVQGTGYLRQDTGPSLSFERMRVSLNNDRDAVIILDGRRDPVRLRGTWTSGRNGDVIVNLTHVNDTRATGRVELTQGWGSGSELRGGGRTTRGRFDVQFSSRGY
jgi:hypothetical protein